METIQTALVEYGLFWRENVATLLLVMGVTGILIGSGSFAGSVAEVRNRPRLLHMLIGMIVPIVYPAIILFTLSYREPGKKRQQKEQRPERVQKMEGAPPPDAPPVLDSNHAPPVANEELLGHAKIAFDQGFFKQVMYDERGNYRGPFVFIVNGNEFKVERIIQVLDQMVIIENFSSDGKTQHLRIPYARIESCTELD